MNYDTLPHIGLRAMEPEDLDLLYRIENDPQLWELGPTNVPYSRYALHDYLAHASADIYADRQVRLVIVSSNGDTVGLADLTNFDPRHLRAEIGIVIKHPHQRHGYGHAALLRLHHYARHTLHLHQLYAVIDTLNQPAMALFKAAQYTQAALLPDWLTPDGHTFRPAALMVYTL